MGKGTEARPNVSVFEDEPFIPSSMAGNQPSYNSLSMEWLSLAITLVGTLLGIAGTFVGIAVVVRTRQLARPRLRLHFGAFALGKNVISEARHRQKRTVIYRLPRLDRDYYLVPFGIGIENQSPIAITSLEVQLEFAAENLLDNSRLVDGQHGPFSFGRAEVSGRVANRFGERAQVKFDIPIVRSEQKIVVWEIVRIPRGHISKVHENQTDSRLEQLWRDCPGFLSTLELRICAWAANCDPVAITGIVAACSVGSEGELTSTATALLERLWSGWAPERGVRRYIRLWRKPWSVELAELVYLTKDALRPDHGDVDPTILERAHHGLLRFLLPPWGFSGEPRAARGLRRLSPSE